MPTRTDVESDPLGDFLCFDLYAASRAVTARYRSLLAEHDLTYPQYLVLTLLGDPACAAGSRTIGEVAAALQLDHSTLTPLLRRLERAGLVMRRRGTVDERVVELRLTDDGRRTVAAFDRVQRGMQQAMGLDEDEARALQVALRRLARAVTPDGA